MCCYTKGKHKCYRFLRVVSRVIINHKHSLVLLIPAIAINLNLADLVSVCMDSEKGSFHETMKSYDTVLGMIQWVVDPPLAPIA